MSESAIQSKILKHLKFTYPNAYIVKLSDKWYSGIPDIMMVYDSVVYFFEVKTKTGKASKLQLHVIGKLLKAGAQAGIVRGISDVKRMIGGE